MPYTWHAKKTGAYARSSTEAYDNALCVYRALYNKGWTLEAICGFWGNVEFEGGYNPWRWEGDNVLSKDSPLIDTSYQHGYGLAQFTPSGKYLHDLNAMSNRYYAPNYSDEDGLPHDGYSQVYFINDYADYIPTASHPETFEQYKQIATSPEDAASIWIHNYERPGSAGMATEPQRRSCARYWFDLLSQIEPPTPGGLTSDFKIYMYLKPYWKRR